MKKRLHLHLFVLMLMSVCCGMGASAQGHGFILKNDWSLSLTREQYRELADIALAVIEKEYPKLCQYIDTLAAPDVLLFTFEADDDVRRAMGDNLPFRRLKNGEGYYKVSLPSFPELVMGFPQGMVASVYLTTDTHTPFWVLCRNDGKERDLKYKELPVLKNKKLVSSQSMLPKGEAELTPEVRKKLVEGARKALETHLPEVYEKLTPESSPTIVRVRYYQGEEEGYTALRVLFRGRETDVWVYFREADGALSDIYFACVSI